MSPAEQPGLKSAYTLSTIIAILALVQSAGGLFITKLYRDNAWVTAAWHGNDLVTLLVAVPILVSARVLSMRGSQRAQLVWLAMLFYMFYNYAFYLFGAALNRFFLIYVSLFTLSIFALIFGLARIDVNSTTREFRPSTPAKLISGCMLLYAALVASVWISQWLRFVLTGKIPQLGGSEQSYMLVASLDLSLQVPFLAIGAYWLWKLQPWGYVLGAVLMIADAIYMLVLVAFSPFAAKAGVPGAWDQAPLWGFVGAGCLIASGLLLGNLHSTEGG